MKQVEASKAMRTKASSRVEEIECPRSRPKKESVGGSFLEELCAMRDEITTLKNRHQDL